MCVNVSVCVGGVLGVVDEQVWEGLFVFIERSPPSIGIEPFMSRRNVWNGPRHLCLWIGVTLGSPTLAALRSALPSSLVLPS